MKRNPSAEYTLISKASYHPVRMLLATCADFERAPLGAGTLCGVASWSEGDKRPRPSQNRNPTHRPALHAKPPYPLLCVFKAGMMTVAACSVAAGAILQGFDRAGTHWWTCWGWDRSVMIPRIRIRSVQPHPIQ